MGLFTIPATAVPPRRVMLLNAKGGCGKSTLATSLAAYYASRNLRTVLIDHDPQGAATHWLSLRSCARPAVVGVTGSGTPGHVTRAWHLRAPPGTERVVIDTPAALSGFDLTRLVREADDVIVPVLPSETDIHAASRFIAQLLLEARIRACSTRVAVVANRVRRSTRMYVTLERFLRRLQLPFVAVLRDTQCYVRAAEEGLGIHEFRPPSRVRRDHEQWRPLMAWLDSADYLPERPARTAAAQPVLS